MTSEIKIYHIKVFFLFPSTKIEHDITVNISGAISDFIDDIYLLSWPTLLQL